MRDREVFLFFRLYLHLFSIKSFYLKHYISGFFVRFKVNIYINHLKCEKSSTLIPKMEAEDLTCSLCLEIFTVPVKITVCGHSFCLQCLTDSMTEATWPCPKCRTIQTKTPEQLPRNFCLEPIVEKYKSSRTNICTTHDLQKKLCKYSV